MSRSICGFIAVISLLALFVSSNVCIAGTVPVVADVTVNAANQNSNLNAITTRGGLLNGLDDTGSNYSFYLKFNLAGVDATTLTSATLIGTYTDDFGGPDSFHQPYFAPDDSWTETGITWNNRPLSGAATTDGVDVTGLTPGDEVRFDVLAEVKQEAAGDGILSLVLATGDGRFGDLEFFASREFDPDRAFRIETSISSTVIPLPPAVWTGAAMLIGALALAFRKIST